MGIMVMDLSNIFFSALHVEIGDKDKPDINMLRHIVWNIIRSQRKKWSDYDTVVIATDGHKYWRREYFPYYKANRKKDRDASDLDWTSIFQIFDTIKQELVEHGPYPVIQIPEAEADDIIAAFALNPRTTSENVLFDDEPEPMLILSGDKDFVQLQAGRPWIKQYNPVRKMMVTSTNPHRFKFEHIVRGDKGDGIPNILSDDASLVNEERQKPIRQVKLDEWYQAGEAAFVNTQLRRGWDRNKKLIDLEEVPEEIQKKTLESFEAQSPNKSKLMPFFMKNRMSVMLENIQDF